MGLGSTAVNKASGCDGIPVEPSRTLKADTIKVLHLKCQQIWKTQQWPQDWKRSILIPIPKKGGTKECTSHQTIALISHASKVMLKILHSRLQHHVNQCVHLPSPSKSLESPSSSRMKREHNTTPRIFQLYPQRYNPPQSPSTLRSPFHIPKGREQF